MNASKTSGPVYDATSVSRILGIACECNDPVPEVDVGEIVVYYGGWSLAELRATQAGQKYVWRVPNDDVEPYAETGYYRVRLRFPTDACNALHWQQQQLLAGLEPGFKRVPIVVAATAYLVHLAATGEDILNGGVCRGSEYLNSRVPGRRGHIVIHRYEGRIQWSRVWENERGYWLAIAKQG
jgi:hypothetical protein